MSAPRPIPQPTLVIGGPIESADVPALCERVQTLLRGSGADAVSCDVAALVHPDVGTVDAVARMQLAARQLGRDLHLHNVSDALQELLALVGLCSEVGLCGRGLRVGVVRETEEREQPRRVEEEGHPGDPVA